MAHSYCSPVMDEINAILDQALAKAPKFTCKQLLERDAELFTAKMIDALEVVTIANQLKQ